MSILTHRLSGLGVSSLPPALSSGKSIAVGNGELYPISVNPSVFGCMYAGVKIWEVRMSWTSSSEFYGNQSWIMTGAPWVSYDGLTLTYEQMPRKHEDIISTNTPVNSSYAVYGGLNISLVESRPKPPSTEEMIKGMGYVGFGNTFTTGKNEEVLPFIYISMGDSPLAEIISNVSGEIAQPAHRAGTCKFLNQQFPLYRADNAGSDDLTATVEIKPREFW